MNTEKASNIIKSNNDLNNLKSKYILQLIFAFLHKSKFLNLIKYNKKFQTRLNLSFKDYKDYFRYFSPIEIELEISPNRNNYCKFINIYEDSDEFIHIYFDNQREEIKRFYLYKDENIKKIKLIIDYPIDSLKNLFENCIIINSIYFKKFNRINITNMNI